MTEKQFIELLPFIKHQFVTVHYSDGTEKEIYFENWEYSTNGGRHSYAAHIKTGKGELLNIHRIKKITFTK